MGKPLPRKTSVLTKLLCWRTKTRNTRDNSEKELDDDTTPPPTPLKYRIPTLFIDPKGQIMDDWISYIIAKHSNLLDPGCDNDEEYIRAWRGFERQSLGGLTSRGTLARPDELRTYYQILTCHIMNPWRSLAGFAHFSISPRLALRRLFRSMLWFRTP